MGIKQKIEDRKFSAGKEMLQEISRIRSKLDEAERYLAEGRAPNSLGILQSSGHRLEQLAAVYALLKDLEETK